MKVALTFLITVFTATATMAAGPVCKTIFATPEAEREAVEQTIKELSALRLEIDQKRAAGDSSVSLTALDRDFYKRENSLLENLKLSKIMTSAQYVEQMKADMSALQESQKRDRSKQETEELKKDQKGQIEVFAQGRPGVFHWIEPGKFEMGYPSYNRKNVSISKPFYMMETLTTQKIWNSVVALAERRFGRSFTNKLEVSFHNPGEINPVENVSFVEISLWLKTLNRLSADGEPSLVEMIPDHKEGDVYRLPTNAQWEFVASARGTITSEYAHGDMSQLNKYAWTKENSGGTTKPVGQLEPLAFDEKNFYDMFGNVGEVMLDGPYFNVQAGVDPFAYVDRHAVRGGNFDTAIGQRFGIGAADIIPSWEKRPGVGFRFIREARK